jgi:NDP-sugar pyrophosphorylase family protein
MKFYQIILIFFIFFVTFLYFSERMLEKTIEQTIRLEGFSSKKTCDDYFVSVPQNQQMMKICKNVYGKNKSKLDNKCKSISKKEFCTKLIQNGWDKNWTKKKLQKEIKNPKIIDAKNKIRKNMGHISEEQIIKCFPNYI